MKGFDAGHVIDLRDLGRNPNPQDLSVAFIVTPAQYARLGKHFGREDNGKRWAQILDVAVIQRKAQEKS